MRRSYIEEKRNEQFNLIPYCTIKHIVKAITELETELSLLVKTENLEDDDSTVIKLKRRMKNLQEKIKGKGGFIPINQKEYFFLGNGGKILLNNEREMLVLLDNAILGRTKGIATMDSPLGRALYGAKVGDKVSYEVGKDTDKRIFNIEVLEIWLPVESKKLFFGKTVVKAQPMLQTA